MGYFYMGVCIPTVLSRCSWPWLLLIFQSTQTISLICKGGVGQNAQGSGVRCPGGVGQNPGCVGQNAHAKILFRLRGAKRPCGAKSPPWGKRPMGVLPQFAYFLVKIMM